MAGLLVMVDNATSEIYSRPAGGGRIDPPGDGAWPATLAGWRLIACEHGDITLSDGCGLHWVG